MRVVEIIFHNLVAKFAPLYDLQKIVSIILVCRRVTASIEFLIGETKTLAMLLSEETIAPYWFLVDLISHGEELDRISDNASIVQTHIHFLVLRKQGK